VREVGKVGVELCLFRSSGSKRNKKQRWKRKSRRV